MAISLRWPLHCGRRYWDLLGGHDKSPDDKNRLHAIGSLATGLGIAEGISDLPA